MACYQLYTLYCVQTILLSSCLNFRTLLLRSFAEKYHMGCVTGNDVFEMDVTEQNIGFPWCTLYKHASDSPWPQSWGFVKLKNDLHTALQFSWVSCILHHFTVHTQSGNLELVYTFWLSETSESLLHTCCVVKCHAPSTCYTVVVSQSSWL